MRLALYEFLAAPAHLWLWLVAYLCGGRFSCGRVKDDESSTDREAQQEDQCPK